MVRLTVASLFGILFLLQLLDLATLALDLALLLLNLGLGLLLLNLLVLHLVADYVSRTRSQSTANGGTRARMTDGGADDRTCTGSQHGADAGSFLAGGKRLPRASGNQEEDSQCKSNRSYQSFRHIGLPPRQLSIRSPVAA
jgi:hypothetical protein